MQRVQSVVLPVLRAALNAHVEDEGLEAPVYDLSRSGVEVVSWIPNIDHREFPLVAVHRSGGPRHRFRPRMLGFPDIELTAVHDAGLVEAEELYEDALEALYDAVRDQTVVPDVGCLHSLSESQGATQIESPFADTWSVQGTIRLGIRSSAA